MAIVKAFARYIRRTTVCLQHESQGAHEGGIRPGHSGRLKRPNWHSLGRDRSTGPLFCC